MARLNGVSNLVSLIYYLAVSDEPRRFYRIAKDLGMSHGTLKRLLDDLVSRRHVVKVGDGYVTNPEYVYVYDGVVFYKYDSDDYLVIVPRYENCDPPDLSEILRSVPASVRLWISMAPP